MATSGLPMPARSAWRWTVATSHCSSSLRGCSITCAPVLRLAIHLDISSEMNEPPKPKIAAITISCPWLPTRMPNFCSTDITMPSRTRTARLVARNRATRLNIGGPFAQPAADGFGAKMWQARWKFKPNALRKLPEANPNSTMPLSASAPYRGRFAPSPTGDLHFGSLLAALGSWLLARHAQGTWRVRVEDIDPPREVAGASQRQLDAAHARGLDREEAIVRQSARSALYEAALQRLLDDGRAFECHCSRSDLAAGGGVHRQCVAKSRRADPAIRLRVPDGTVIAFDDDIQGPQQQDVSREVGDFVLRRTEGYWAYQLAVVVDDAAQDITDVVRGADLLDSTPRQILLQRALGLPTPRYAHLPLVVDPEGRKLSKSLAAMPVDDANPLPALRAAWRSLGQDPRILEHIADVPGALAAARTAFVPGDIPAGSIALHNTGVAFAT